MNLFPDDPQKQAMMMMALGLLGGAPGQRKNFGADLGHAGLLGMQGLQQAKAYQLKSEEEKQQREFRAMQMAQMKAQQEKQSRIDALPGQYFGPVALQPKVDDEGNAMPPVPERFDMRGYANALARTDPATGIPLLAQLQKQEAPVKLGINDRLVNPTTRQEVVPAQGDQWRVLGRDEKTGQIIQENTRTGERKAVGSMPPQVNVSTNMPPLERKEQGDKGSLNVKNYGDLQASAASARKELALLTGIEKLDLDTSKFTPLNSTIAAWAVGMGATPQALKDLAAKGQSFTGFTMDLVLQRQLAQKGPQTESDARRLEQTTAQLGNTTEANRLLVSFSKAQNKRTVDQEKFYGDWWKKHKTFEGADDAWFNGKGGTSLWDEPELKKYQGGNSNVIDFSRLPSGRSAP